MSRGRSSTRKNEHKKPIEQYDHKGKKRTNNPPVGLVTPETDKDKPAKKYAYDPHIDPALQFDSKRSQIEKIIDGGIGAKTIEEAKAALAELKKRQQPYLNWTGKAERTTYEVPTVSLHVHERIDPKTIIEAVRKRNGRGQPTQPSLFESPAENPPLREAIDFYKHAHNWSNRLIAGDSLLVMNSLLEKEGMAGQVQMVYIDPPYGIKYGSNFQPFVNKRDVKDGKDEDLTQEPEMIRAFRDTWELGMHSYLTYLRDRLWVVKELLHESGSCFVQISDENVHLVRNLMDEVFGKQNSCQIIPFRKKLMPLGATLVEGMCDFLLWYAKDLNSVKFRHIFRRSTPKVTSRWTNVELPDGSRRKLTKLEGENLDLLPTGSRVYRLVSQRAPSYSEAGVYDFNFMGRTFPPPAGGCWVTSREKMERLAIAGRLEGEGDNLSYVYFHEDFPYSKVTNLWDDTSPVQNKSYVVQTTELVIERCLLMTTDPGDVVFDPTCGSGTAAFVAEEWGRRWITCDTSRVSVTLAKQRLMTALYDYYELAHSDEGVGSGFTYKSVPHVTLKSIANNPEIREGMTRDQIDAAIAKYADQETLYDLPLPDKSKARVSGPFTVEAVPAPTVRSLVEISAVTGETEPVQPSLDGRTPPQQARLGVVTVPQPADASIGRSGATLRHAEWRDELLKTGIRGRSGQRIDFARVEPIGGTRWIHADAETKEDKPQRVVISFGPEDSPLEQRQVELAWEEARTLRPKPTIIVFAAFQFDPEAAKDIDELKSEKTGITFLKAQMNADLLTEDLKKKRASNESFWLIGQPDIELSPVKTGEHKGMWQVKVQGFDYYNTRTGIIESGGTEKIAMWLLDTDYDGRSLLPRQVFFTMADEDEGWARLAKNLKAEIDPELIKAYRGTVSLPFEAGKYKRAAVKIVDDRGIESLKIVELR